MKCRKVEASTGLSKCGGIGFNKKLCEFLGIENVSLKDFTETNFENYKTPFTLARSNNWMQLYSYIFRWLTNLANIEVMEIYGDKCVV